MKPGDIYRSVRRQLMEDFVQPAVGLGESALTVGSSLAAMPFAGWKGIHEGIRYGSVDRAADAMNEFMEQHTWQPRTDQGQQQLTTIGDAAAVPFESLARSPGVGDAWNWTVENSPVTAAAIMTGLEVADPTKGVGRTASRVRRATAAPPEPKIMPQIEVDGRLQYGSFVEPVHVDDLINMQGNRLGKTDLEELKAQIQADGGLREPVIIQVGQNDRSAIVGEGNHRVQAAKELGYEYIPARVIVQRETYAPQKHLWADLIPEEGVYFKSDAKPSEVFRNVRVAQAKAATPDPVAKRAADNVTPAGYSTRFPTIKAFNDWKKNTPDSDPAKREIMYEVLQEQRAKVDAGALEKDGRPFGAPKGMTAEKREAMVKHYADRIERGLETFPPGYFYQEGRDTIRSLTPDAGERRILAHQIDQTSSQVGPAENVNYTMRGREQRNAGLDVSTTIYPNKAREPFTAISEGREDFTGYKRDRYGNLLTPEQSRADLPEGAEMAPNDRWEFRAAGFNTVPSDPKNVAYMDRFREDALEVLNARRAEAGQPPLTLEQAQEVHWAVIRAETEGRPLAMNRGNDQIGGAFDRLEYSHTYEAAPGRTSDHYPDMTPTQQRDLLSVFNEGGRDPLVEAMGGDLQRPVRGHVGYYDGQYNPGQTARSFVSRTGSLGLEPASTARVNTTEGIRSLALAQDAYAGNVFTPISNAKNPKFNGVNVNLGGKVTKAELKAAVELAESINPNMVVVDGPSGLRAWIPGDTSKKAQNQVQDFANELDLPRQNEVTYGKVESDYRELNWDGGNPMQEDWVGGRATQTVLNIIDEAGAQGMSGIVAKADSPETRAILGKVADKYEALRSAGIGLPNEKLIDVLRTWADKGLPGVREMVRKGLAPAAVLGILGASQSDWQDLLAPQPDGA